MLLTKNCKKSSHREADGSTETASQGFTSESNTLKEPEVCEHFLRQVRTNIQL